MTRLVGASRTSG